MRKHTDLFLIHSKLNQTLGPLQLGMCKMSYNVFPDIWREFPRFAFVPITFCPAPGQAMLLWARVPLLLPQLSAVFCATAAPALHYFNKDL